MGKSLEKGGTARAAAPGQAVTERLDREPFVVDELGPGVYQGFVGADEHQAVRVDAGYDAARLSRELAGRYQQLLIRLNFRCCFYAEPPEVPPPG